jgi:hypothetical protein
MIHRLTRVSGTYAVVLSLLFVVGLAQAIGALASSSPTSSTGKLTVRVAADSYVAQAAPRRAYGTAPTLVAGSARSNARVTFLKFAVRGIPAGATDVRATLVLNGVSRQLPQAIEVRKVATTGWTERKLTRATAPAVGKVLVKHRTDRRAVTQRIPLGSVVKRDGTFALAVTSPSTKDVAVFRSKESGSKGPQLEVKYRVPAAPKARPSASPTVSPTVAPSAAPTPTETPTPTPTASPTMTPVGCAPRFPGDPGCTGEMFYGASVEGGDPTKLESETGHKLSLYRSYMHADTPASKLGSRASADVAAGRLPLISTKVPGSWAAVANGTHDAWLLERIRVLAAVPGPVWLALHHEPSGDGIPADWVRMQQHARRLIDANSTNIALVGILNGWDFKQRNGTPEVWNHPVGTGVDVMGFDSYNGWSATNGKQWQDAADVLSPGVTIASWGYPTLVGEHGCRTDPTQPGRAAQWMREAYAFGVAHGFVGMSYFDSGLNSPDGTWELDAERLPVFRTSLVSDPTARL